MLCPFCYSQKGIDPPFNKVRVHEFKGQSAPATCLGLAAATEFRGDAALTLGTGNSLTLDCIDTLAGQKEHQVLI